LFEDITENSILIDLLGGLFQEPRSMLASKRVLAKAFREKRVPTRNDWPTTFR